MGSQDEKAPRTCKQCDFWELAVGDVVPDDKRKEDNDTSPMRGHCHRNAPIPSREALPYDEDSGFIQFDLDKSNVAALRACGINARESLSLELKAMIGLPGSDHCIAGHGVSWPLTYEWDWCGEFRSN